MPSRNPLPGPLPREREIRRGYGVPPQFEKNLQRRESPDLTRVGASSVSFTPLQGLFGIVTPNGLHFERHHQGWWDIDPNQHRLMVMGMVRQPKIYTAADAAQCGLGGAGRGRADSLGPRVIILRWISATH